MLIEMSTVYIDLDISLIDYVDNLKK